MLNAVKLKKGWLCGKNVETNTFISNTYNNTAQLYIHTHTIMCCISRIEAMTFTDLSGRLGHQPHIMLYEISPLFCAL